VRLRARRFGRCLRLIVVLVIIASVVAGASGSARAASGGVGTLTYDRPAPGYDSQPNPVPHDSLVVDLTSRLSPAGARGVYLRFPRLSGCHKHSRAAVVGVLG